MTDFNHKMGVESIYISASVFFYSLALKMNSLYPSAEPLYFFASVSYPGFIQQIAIIFKDFPRTSFDFHGLPTGMYITDLYIIIYML